MIKSPKQFVIKHNEILTEHNIKTRLSNYCPIINMETILMNTEKSKTNEPHEFVLSLPQIQILELRSSNKQVFQNLSHYMWKNMRIKQQ